MPAQNLKQYGNIVDNGGFKFQGHSVQRILPEHLPVVLGNIIGRDKQTPRRRKLLARFREMDLSGHNDNPFATTDPDIPEIHFYSGLPSLQKYQYIIIVTMWKIHRAAIIPIGSVLEKQAGIASP